jgi:hypothetical protein
MAERGKAEETSPDAPGDAEASALVGYVRDVFGPSADVDVHLHSPGEDPSDVDVVIEAKLASIPIMVRGEHFIQAASRLNRPGTDLIPDLDVPLERDDAYYDEVRQAVGRGAPSVLLGTSTRSLEANVRKIEAAQQESSKPNLPAMTPFDQLALPRRTPVWLLALIIGLSGAAGTFLILGWVGESLHGKVIEIALLAAVIVFATLLGRRSKLKGVVIQQRIRDKASSSPEASGERSPEGKGTDRHTNQ